MKMVGITVCNECPHYVMAGLGRMAICMMVNDGVIAEGLELARSRFPIPKWCPLPDMEVKND